MLQPVQRRPRTRRCATVDLLVAISDLRSGDGDGGRARACSSTRRAVLLHQLRDIDPQRLGDLLERGEIRVVARRLDTPAATAEDPRLCAEPLLRPSPTLAQPLNSHTQTLTRSTGYSVVSRTSTATSGST